MSQKKSKNKKIKAVEVEIIDNDNPRSLTPKTSQSSSSRSLTTPDPVSLYLKEISKYSLLSKEEEYDLAVKYKETGDPLAAEALVKANLRFVVKIAAEYSKFGSKLIDLIQEGNVGLMHAVKEFNPHKNVKLISYAVWWIRGHIREYLMRQYSMVRIGTNQKQRKLFYKLQKELDHLDKMGHEPDYKLLGTQLGVSEKDIQDMNQRMRHRDVSLDTRIDPDSSTSLLDLQSDSQITDVQSQMEYNEELSLLLKNIDQIRPHLNKKEIFILENRLLADPPMKLKEIGDHYGTSREAVRQMEARLLKKIRKSFD